MESIAIYTGLQNEDYKVKELKEMSGYIRNGHKHHKNKDKLCEDISKGTAEGACGTKKVGVK